MTVKLNIADDEELRNYIKDVIKGQVMAIVREEFLAIVKGEMERKIKGLTTTSFDYMLKVSLDRAVSDLLYKEYKLKPIFASESLSKLVSDRLDEVIQAIDVKRLLDTLTAEKLRKLIN